MFSWSSATVDWHGSSTSVTVAQLTCPHLSEETTWTARKHNCSQQFGPLNETPGRCLISVFLDTNQVSGDIQIFAKFKINNNKQNCASKDQKVLRWCKQGSQLTDVFYRSHRPTAALWHFVAQKHTLVKKNLFFVLFCFAPALDSNAGSKNLTSRPNQTKLSPKKLQECSCSARADPTHALPARTFDDSVIIPPSCEEGHGWRPGPSIRNMCEERTRQSGTFLGPGRGGGKKSSDSHDFVFF